MFDLRSLPPEQFARQLAKPEGAVGIAIADWLNTANREANRAVFERLRLAPGCRVLEIGPGNGKLLPELMRLAPDLYYVGVDASATMVAEARQYNAALIAEGRAFFHCGAVEELPQSDGTFDRAFALGVLYLWPDPVRALSEMRRVLRPGGVSIVGVFTPDTAAVTGVTEPAFGFRFHDRPALEAMHRRAGFASVAVETFTWTTARPDGMVIPLHAYLVMAEA